MWLFCVVSIFLIFFVLFRSMRRPKGYPPGPLQWPIVGNMFSLDLKRSWSEQFIELSKKYGKIFSFQFGELKYVIIVDSKSIRDLFNRDDMQGRPRLYYVDHLIYFENAGIIMSHGPAWKEQRRFCLRHLRDYGFAKTSSEDFILDQFKQLASDIRPSDLPKDEPNEVCLDLALNAATANVIWWMMACKKVTAEDEDFIRIIDILQQILGFNLCAMLSFMPSVLACTPGWVYGESKMREKRKILFEYFQSVIDEHARTLDESEPRDLIDSFLIEKQRREKDGGTDSHFTNTMMIATLLDLFNAGNETTATTLRWFFLYMIHFPDVQAKVHAEIEEVLGVDRAPAWADQANMHYTVATIHEVWRIATIAPIGLDHQSEAVIEYEGYILPKGTNVLGIVDAVHSDPELWDEPEKFRPERFLDESGKFVKNDNVIPFLVGKRQCMGESLARIVTFLGITYLMQLFKFDKVENEKYSLKPNVEKSPVIHAPFPYKVSVTPRH